VVRLVAALDIYDFSSIEISRGMWRWNVDIWGKIDDFVFGFFGGQFWDTIFFVDCKQNDLKLIFCEIQNLSGFAGIAYGVHIDTFLVGICAKRGY
jgi:hypothetical protein